MNVLPVTLKAIKPGGLFVCAQPTAPEELDKSFKLVEKGFFPFDNKGHVTNLPYFVGRTKEFSLNNL